jgi:hypothetical protein
VAASLRPLAVTGPLSTAEDTRWDFGGSDRFREVRRVEQRADPERYAAQKSQRPQTGCAEDFSEMTIPQGCRSSFRSYDVGAVLAEELETGGAQSSLVEVLDVDVVSFFCLFMDEAKKCSTRDKSACSASDVKRTRRLKLSTVRARFGLRKV